MSILVSLLFFACSPQLKQDNEYSFITKHKFTKEQMKFPVHHLIVSYQDQTKKYCNIGFRIFIQENDERVTFNTRSKNYLGSYVPGADCKDKFRISLIGKLEYKEQKSLTAFAVPTNLQGEVLRVDLRQNFSFDIEN